MFQNATYSANAALELYKTGTCSTSQGCEATAAVNADRPTRVAPMRSELYLLCFVLQAAHFSRGLHGSVSTRHLLLPQDPSAMASWTQKEVAPRSPRHHVEVVAGHLTQTLLASLKDVKDDLRPGERKRKVVAGKTVGRIKRLDW